MPFAVWKKVLEPTFLRQPLELPKGAKILHAAEQGEDICVWFQCDTHAPYTDDHEVIVLPTGNELYADEGELVYLGTAKLRGGRNIMHVFEVKIAGVAG